MDPQPAERTPTAMSALNERFMKLIRLAFEPSELLAPPFQDAWHGVTKSYLPWIPLYMKTSPQILSRTCT